ncbi:MAG TPA: MFS transporter [Chloroflexota bacterium]|jgi:MFS family permease
MQLSRNAVLALCTAVLVLTSASITVFSLCLPWIEREFGWPRAVSTIPYTVAMIAWGISAPLLGKLADDHGARPVMLGSIVGMATGFLGMGFAQNLWQLALCFGVLTGLSMGGCGVSMGALLVSKHFDARSRGWAVSVVQAASPLYPLIFAPLLYVVIRLSDWRTAALVTSGLLWGVALPLAWLGARDPDAARLGAARRQPWSACLPYLRNRSMLALFVARLACGLAFFQSAHLVAIGISKGFDPRVGTTALSIYGLSAVCWALVFGRLADRWGRSRTLGISYLLRGVGTLGLATAVPSEWAFYALVALGIGPTFGTIAVQNVLFYEVVGPRLAGVILGLSFVIHQLGSSIGPQLASIVFDMTGTYNYTMIVVGLVLLASAAISFSVDIKKLGAWSPGAVPAPVRASSA